MGDTGVSGDRLRVLVVDDDPAVADLIGTFLEAADDRLAVSSETDPHDGMAAVRAEGFDAVVSDYHMPGMDGLEFLERVGQVARGTPRFLQTADDDAAIDERARAVGGA
jgi:CheY-like chemotaxis protein